MRGIREIIKNPFQSEFYRNIINLFSGMFLARLFPALFALIIVRIYSPENFGIFVLYLTIASVLSILGTGKYENAIILTDSSEQKRHLFQLSQKINLVVNSIVLVSVFLYILISGEKNTDRILMLLLIPLYSFFLAAVQLIRNILISYKRFGNLSALEIFRSILTGGLQCLFFIWPETGLFLGAVVAQAIIFFWYSFRLSETKRFRLARFSAPEKELMQRYINFPKFSVASEIFNFLSSKLPVFMIKPFFGATMLGLYSFPQRYISTPVQLLSVSISRVYVQKAQSLKEDIKKLGAFTLSLFKNQFALGIIPFTVLALWGETLFRFFFGAEWEFSGFLAQLIAPWLFLVMLSSPLSSIMIVIEKQKVSMKYNIYLLVSRFISLLVGGFILKDISWTIGLFSLTGFVFFSWLCIYSLRMAGVDLKKALLFAIKILLATVGPLVLLKLWL